MIFLSYHCVFCVFRLLSFALIFLFTLNSLTAIVVYDFSLLSLRIFLISCVFQLFLSFLFPSFFLAFVSLFRLFIFHSDVTVYSISFFSIFSLPFFFVCCQYTFHINQLFPIFFLSYVFELNLCISPSVYASRFPFFYLFFLGLFIISCSHSRYSCTHSLAQSANQLIGQSVCMSASPFVNQCLSAKYIYMYVFWEGPGFFHLPFAWYWLSVCVPVSVCLYICFPFHPFPVSGSICVPPPSWFVYLFPSI